MKGIRVLQQRVMGAAKTRQFHDMFGESFAAVAPLATAVGFGVVLLVGVGARTLIGAPDVTVSQKRRATLIPPVNDSTPIHYHDHWLRASRTKHIMNDDDVHHTDDIRTTRAIAADKPKWSRLPSPKPFGGAVVDSIQQVNELNAHRYNGAHVFGLHHGIYAKNPRPQMDMQVVEQL